MSTAEKNEVISPDEKQQSAPAWLEAHLGTWEGTYTILDGETLKVVDTHRSKLEIVLDQQGRYAQRNTYTWLDGEGKTERVEVHNFPGFITPSGRLVIDSERVEGYSIGLDERSCAFYGSYKVAASKSPLEKVTTWDVISLLTPDRRVRTWQVLKGDKCFRIVQAQETRICTAPIATWESLGKPMHKEYPQAWLEREALTAKWQAGALSKITL
eukprot:gb/GEZN01014196.1/.p1 GENE.gb/GEZN01014196.1/~~gb/GEZN01014196.1/.p1  ORF type:complete len:213 (-),score=18.23 gb/GEZN01014196.1/:138-776(-)